MSEIKSWNQNRLWKETEPWSKKQTKTFISYMGQDEKGYRISQLKTNCYNLKNIFY